MELFILEKEVVDAWSRQKPPHFKDLVRDHMLPNGKAISIESIGLDAQFMLELYSTKRGGRRFDELDCKAVAKLGYDSPLQEMSGLSRAYYLGGILLCIVRHFLPNEELTHYMAPWIN